VFPNLAVCRERAGLPPDADAATVVGHPAVVEIFRRVLAELAAGGTGSSTFVARAILMAEPPSLDAREVTDKGSINQKAVLQHRAALVEELYAAERTARVIAST
jgi:feruloyl-CoA synthase